MLNFVKLTIEGFGSYAETVELCLDQKKKVLVKASNGQGKTSIFSAITWALYGKSLKGTSEVNTWEHLRPKSYKGTKVEITFNKGEVYTVTRCQNYKGTLSDGAKGNNRLLLSIAGEPSKEKSKILLQKQIEDLLGMSYKVFINSVMFGQGLQRLIQESNTEKKKIFEEVFNLDFINIAKDLANKELKSVEVDLTKVKAELYSVESELNVTTRAYKDIKEREENFKNTNEVETKRLKDRKSKLLSQLSELKTKYDEDKAALVDSKLLKARKSLQIVKEKLEAAKTLSNKPLEEVIDYIIVLLDKNKVKQALEELKKIKSAFKDITELSEDRERISDKIYSLQDTKRKLEKIAYECDSVSDRIVQVRADINDLKSKELKIVSPKYKKQLEKLESQLVELKAQVETHQAKANDYHWLINDPLSNKGIKAFLFDSCLNSLNNTLSSYAKILGFKIAFEVDLDSTKKDFVTLIEREGHIVDYDDLSGGEKQLCNVAMALAMNESLTQSKGINIAFLDEVFESLDADNIELVISLLDSVYEGKTLFLISHQQSLPISNSKVLEITKSKGISTLKFTI